MEHAQDFEVFSVHEEGETSKKKKADKSKTIKRLRNKLKQQIVLERVIKQRYEIVSNNFAKTDEAFRKLALKRVKEKRKNKKIVKNNNRLWRISRQLKIKNKLLKNKLIVHSPLQILAKTAENFGQD